MINLLRTGSHASTGSSKRKLSLGNGHPAPEEIPYRKIEFLGLIVQIVVNGTTDTTFGMSCVMQDHSRR